jgi:hypothetical protein
MHLVVALSAHGYGHAAMTSPVVDRLRARLPALRVTLRGALPADFLRERYGPDCVVQQTPCDVGMLMASPFEQRLEASALAYAAFHADWDARVQREADELAALGADLVLANVPYLPLAGASRAGVPAVALACLNWMDIYRHYFGSRPEAKRILAEMLEAYGSARCVLQAEPSMPMNDLPRRKPIGPIARRGTNRAREIRAALKLGPETRLVLLATGGVPHRIDLAHWPRMRGVHWLLAPPYASEREDMTETAHLGLALTDALASADAVVGKPGYGTFAEAACNGVPMLYVRRSDWPEEPYLVRWMQQHARAAEVPLASFASGDLHAALDALWAAPRKPPLAPTGADQAAALILELA